MESCDDSQDKFSSLSVDISDDGQQRLQLSRRRQDKCVLGQVST